MSSPFTAMKAAIAAHTAFAETWGYVPIGSVNTASASKTVRVRRNQAAEIREIESGGNTAGRYKSYRAEILIPIADLASPEPGDLWTGELVRGDGGSVTFVAGVAQASDGCWLIPIEYNSDRLSAGGSKVGGAR